MLYTAHSKRALPKGCKDSFSLWYSKYVKLEPLQRQTGPEGLANHEIISLFALNISKLQPVLLWQLRGGEQGSGRNSLAEESEEDPTCCQLGQKQQVR